MKKTLILYTFLVLSKLCIAQADTIFHNNEKIVCRIKEITPDAVKYSFQEEEPIFAIYKNAIQKIIFENGRIQTFAEATSLKKIESVNDYEYVAITRIENEVKGLFKVGEVSSKAKGTTTFANQERVKERAYRKLKIQAAIQGGNMVYLTNQRTDGNRYGSYFQTGSQAETNLTGVLYTNEIPNYSAFEKLLAGKKEFNATHETKLYSSASTMAQTYINKQFNIISMKNENGLIILEGQLEGVSDYSRFRVVNFTHKTFHIFYEDKNTQYNIKISL